MSTKDLTPNIALNCMLYYFLSQFSVLFLKNNVEFFSIFKSNKTEILLHGMFLLKKKNYVTCDKQFRQVNTHNYGCLLEIAMVSNLQWQIGTIRTLVELGPNYKDQK